MFRVGGVIMSGSVMGQVSLAETNYSFLPLWHELRARGEWRYFCRDFGVSSYDQAYPII